MHALHPAATVVHHRPVHGGHAVFDEIGHFRGVLLERSHGPLIRRRLRDDDACRRRVDRCGDGVVIAGRIPFIIRAVAERWTTPESPVR